MTTRKTRHGVRVGTSGWSYPDWRGVFYPVDAKPGEFLATYAERFDTVEVDESYYRTPSPSDCQRWSQTVPDEFQFTLKMPKAVVHGGGPRDRNLVDENIWSVERTGDEAKRFLESVAELGQKCAAILLQCPRYPKRLFGKWQEFVDRLASFLEPLSDVAPYSLEVRNGEWVTPAFRAALKKMQVSLAVADLRGPSGRAAKTAPDVREFFRDPKGLVADGPLILRLIGDRYEMDHITKQWDKVVADRAAAIVEWADALEQLAGAKKLSIYAYVNNHFAGHGPETARQLIEELRARGV